MRRSASARLVQFKLLGALVASVVWPAVASADVVINEIDYDQPSTDTAEFIELKNTGATAVSLSGHSVVLINGSGNTTYATFALPAVTLAPGQHYVLCGDPLQVANCNQDVSPDSNLLQNGAPDAVALMVGGAPVDRVSYEGNVPGFVEGTGAAADEGSPLGLSRCPDGADSNNNSVDFALRAPTPGATNNCGGGGGVIGLCGEPATAISAIQGSGATSPLGGQTVNVEAVVVGDFQGTGALSGFFLEEELAGQDADTATSEGLFVFQGALPGDVAVGQVVRVRGEVVEFGGLTELTNVSEFVVCPGTVALAPRAITLPVASATELERYEGMLVEWPQTLTVTGNFELGRFGSLDLSVGGRLYQPTEVVSPGVAANERQALNDRSRIILDDARTSENPNPIPYKDGNNTRRLGDTVTGLVGILDGRFGAYRVQPVGPVSFASGNPRPAAPPGVGGRLRVASFNVLNFFTTIDSGQPICGPTGGLDCRGANNAAELDRQRTKLLNALAAMGADLVALVELENNPSASLASLVDGLNLRLGAGSYSFINTGTIGTDAIKVGLIYKPSKLTPRGPFALLTSAVNPAFRDTKNRPALAQTFTEAAAPAGRFTVVVNHLKSKGSACTDVGDPDVGDGQANCNLTRTLAAGALRDWIAADPTGSQDADFLLMGDLNAYAKEDPIATLAQAGYVRLPSAPPAPTHSFQFQGQSGSLDHAVASAALSAQVAGAAEWHINSDEPVVLDYNTEFKTDDPFRIDDVFRAADHDVIVVGLDLVGAPAAVPALGAGARGLLLFGLLGIGALGLARRRGGRVA